MKDIGIIIPVRGLSWMTANLLDSLDACSIYKDNFKIFIMDNGSSDEEYKNLLKEVEKHKMFVVVEREIEPIGFVKAVNKGIRFMQEYDIDYFFIMNNDTMVTYEWDSRLLDTLKKPRVGMVGPMTSPPDWRELEQAKSFIENKIKYFQMAQSLEKFGVMLRENFDKEEKELDFLAFYCIGMKMEMIREVGLLDEDYNLGLFDDDDFCYRVKKNGKYKIVLRKDVYVHHYHNSSFIEYYGMEKYSKFLEENKAIFMKKHGFDPWDRVKVQM